MALVPEISKLSNAQLVPGLHWSDVFIAEGCSDFHAVCNWLWKLPYGANSSEVLEAVANDRCGTCSTKHGVAADLAIELDLPIYKYLVYYKLDKSIRPGVDKVLEKHALSFVPTSHCVLMEGTHLVDLTWGNKTGKLKDLTEFDLYVKVEPLPSEQDHATLNAWALLWYGSHHLELENFTPEDVHKIRTASIHASRIHCEC